MKKNYTFLSVSLIAIIMLSSCNNKDHIEVNSLKAQLDSVSNLLNEKIALEEQRIANKKLVADMYQELFGNKNVEAADKYIVDDYIQHNPYATDGREALKNVLKTWFKNAAKDTIDIHHLGADGDFVYIHTKAKLGNKDASVIDIFRIEDHKIVEHWDVIQEVPEKSINPHPMF